MQPWVLWWDVWFSWRDPEKCLAVALSPRGGQGPPPAPPTSRGAAPSPGPTLCVPTPGVTSVLTPQQCCYPLGCKGGALESCLWLDLQQLKKKKGKARQGNPSAISAHPAEPSLSPRRAQRRTHPPPAPTRGHQGKPQRGPLPGTQGLVPVSPVSPVSPVPISACAHCPALPPARPGAGGKQEALPSVRLRK